MRKKSGFPRSPKIISRERACVLLLPCDRFFVGPADDARGPTAGSVKTRLSYLFIDTRAQKTLRRNTAGSSAVVGSNLGSTRGRCVERAVSCRSSLGRVPERTECLAERRASASAAGGGGGGGGSRRGCADDELSVLQRRRRPRERAPL